MNKTIVKTVIVKTGIIGSLLAAAIAVPAYASLMVGAKAPLFSAPASLGGKEFKFTLADALKKGPVVLYFYPAAFTKGCTIEAHNFADAMDQYTAAGATVIGVSHDPIDKLDKFSDSECRGKFPVAADADQSIMKSYDAVSSDNPDHADRTSYVIAPTGEVLYTFTDRAPDQHVPNTLAVVQKWAKDHPEKS